MLFISLYYTNFYICRIIALNILFARNSIAGCITSSMLFKLLTFIHKHGSYFEYLVKGKYALAILFYDFYYSGDRSKKEFCIGKVPILSRELQNLPGNWIDSS